MFNIKLLFLLHLIYLLEVNAVDQNCKFSYYKQSNDSNDGLKIPYYECMITGAELLNDTEPVITHTSTNNRTNLEVEAITYSGGHLTFIPNSIFEVFPNVSLFSMFATKLEVLRPEFWKNANKLKVIYIPHTNLKQLSANLFVEAKNLEHINLNFNAIEVVDKLTFSGLEKLQGVYLQGNKISLLYPDTFSKISALKVLDLTKNTCIDKKFLHVQLQKMQLEAEIRKFCAYDHAEELAEIKRLRDDQELKLSKKFEDLAEKIKNELLEKFSNLTEILVNSCKSNEKL